MNHIDCDVAVVGASLGGCTAATLFARTGLRVALLERNADADHFKRLCTHFIQPSAVPTIDRLGIADAIVAAGGKRNVLEVWTQWGWIKGTATSKGYNLRRQKLDPLMRTLAASTPGVEFVPGCTARALISSNGRVSGLEAERQSGSLRVSARLVVGADGRESVVGKLSGLRPVDKPNNRFVYFTYYRGLPVSPTANSRYWYLDPILTYAFENDDDTTLLGVFLPHARHAEFKADLERNFVRLWESVTDAPCISKAERVGEMRGMVNMPNRRRPAAGPGVAVVGDAALNLDPIWGTGCGFAMQSAAWLVDETAATLADRHSPPRALDAALARYRRMHAHRTRGHALHIADFSRVRKNRLFEILLYSAATRDETMADTLLAYLGREDGLLDLTRPSNMIRALQVNTRFAWQRYRA